MLKLRQDEAICEIVERAFPDCEISGLGQYSEAIVWEDQCSCASNDGPWPCVLGVSCITSDVDLAKTDAAWKALMERKAAVEEELREWAEGGGLEWYGCEGCDSHLDIELILHPRSAS